MDIVGLLFGISDFVFVTRYLIAMHLVAVNGFVAPNKVTAVGMDIIAYGWATASVDLGCVG